MNYNVNNENERIIIGEVGENLAESCTIDYSAWVEEYGEGDLRIRAIREGDAEPYPVANVETADGVATWTYTAADTAVKGFGEVQVLYYVGDVLAKSRVWKTYTYRSLSTSSEEVPDPYADWLSAVERIGGQVEADAEAASVSADSASASATLAAGSASEAAESALSASRSASAAMGSASAASTSAESAASSATAASRSATEASNYEYYSEQYMNEAKSANFGAESARTGAENAKAAAQASATAAAQSAESIEESADTIQKLLDNQIHDTATGTIATYPDGADMPMVSLVADIDPIQDLHGYDRPWVGGGNGNLFKATPYRGGYNYSAGTSLKVDTDVMDYEITSDGKISINITTAWRGRLFATDALEAGDYTFRCYGDISGIRASWYITDSDLNVVELVANQQNQGWGSTYTRTITQGQRIALHLGANAVTTLVTEFQVNTGTTIQPIVPFENICPISGWDSVDVSVAGKNLFNGVWESGTINSTTGAEETATGFSRSVNKIKVKPNTSYAKIANGTVGVRCFDENHTYIGNVAATQNVFTTLANTSYIRLVVSDGLLTNPIGINTPSTATDYEPYQGNTYTTTLPQTVYGGTLDVVSGVLTVDMKYDQMTYAYLSSLTSSYIGFASNVTQVGGNAVWVRNWNYTDYPANIDGGIKAKCNAFPISMHNKAIFSSQYRTYFGVGSMTSVDEFLSAVQTLETSGNGLWIAHELATPTTIQLTPQEVEILKGRNNVWANSGDVTVEYIADTKLYIQKVIS